MSVYMCWRMLMHMRILMYICMPLYISMYYSSIMSARMSIHMSPRRCRSRFPFHRPLPTAMPMCPGRHAPTAWPRCALRRRLSRGCARCRTYRAASAPCWPSEPPPSPPRSPAPPSHAHSPRNLASTTWRSYEFQTSSNLLDPSRTFSNFVEPSQTPCHVCVLAVRRAASLSDLPNLSSPVRLVRLCQTPVKTTVLK